MARTISGNNTASITLTSGDSPVTVTGTIDVAGAGALYGPATGAPWTVTNSSTGVITTGFINGNGVSLASGSVVNAAGGTISSTNTASGGTEMGDAVIIGGSSGGVGTIDNSGVLTNAAAGGPSFVAELDSSGSIINEASGTITGVSRGVGIRNDAATATVGSVTNLGTITGTNTLGGSYGVAVIGGDVVSNGSGAVISNFGLGVGFVAYQNTSPGTFSNAGTINDANGVNMETGGAATNAVGGLITASGTGVIGASTLVNYGAISGGVDAVYMANFGLLVAESGSTLSGIVDGSGGTLEMGTGTGSVSDITNFSTIAFDTGATAEVAGSAQALLDVTVTGFVTTDTLVITGATNTISSFTGGMLVLGGTAPTTIDLGTVPGNPTATPNAGDTDITLVPCFRAGTRILTDAGEVAVERLKAGMRVVTCAGGREAAVTWVGHRRIDCARHPRPADVWPVRIAADAFGAAMPHRPLYLSPDHAVFLNGELIPARHLVNGASVRQVACEQVTYFHVELADHSVLLANGLPAESYLDTGNRALFAGETREPVEKTLSASA